jgi:WD40 repeat protein
MDTDNSGARTEEGNPRGNRRLRPAVAVLIALACVGVAGLAVATLVAWRRSTQPRRVPCANEPLSVAWDPSGETIAVGEEAGGVEVFDARTGAPLGGAATTFSRRHESPVWSLAFFPSGGRLAGAWFDAECFVLNPGRFSHDDVATIGSPGAAQYGLAVAPGGGSVAVAGHGGVRIWSLADGSLERELPSSGRTISVAYSHSGAVIATADGDGGVRLYTGDGSGEVIGRHGPEANCVAFSHDGALLASAADDSTVKLWWVTDRHLIRETVTAFRGCSVTFSPDDALLVASGREGIAGWRVSDGAEVRIPTEGLAIHRWARAAFSPRDGTLAVTDGTALWLFPPRAIGR